MISFALTVEQLRSAPLEVRRWIEHEAAQALAALGRPARDPSQVEAAAIAACASEEALRIFEAIKDNFVLSQVFFELARDSTPGPRIAPLHALNTGEMVRHTRLGDGEQLVEAFNAINAVFRQIRNDPGASLFGFDEYGHVYIHEITHLSIRRLWEQLVQAHVTGAPQSVMEDGPATVGFAPPQVGPSEPVALHRPDGLHTPNFGG